MSGSMGQAAAAFSRGDGSRVIVVAGGWANQLCQRWTSWMDGANQLLQITRQGDLINWVRQDGGSGTARIED